MNSVEKPGRVEKSLDYLAWHHSVGCVLDVFHENQRREGNGASKIKASSDAWAIASRLRREVHERACCFWCRRSGRDDTYFPLSEDATARLYFKIRKRLVTEVAGFDEEVRRAAGGLPEESCQARTLFDEDELQ